VIAWNLLLVGARVRTTHECVWSAFYDADHVGFDVQVPIGSLGTVVEVDGTANDPDRWWVVRWDDVALGHALFNEPLVAVEVSP
jgi:hypothetical protein